MVILFLAILLLVPPQQNEATIEADRQEKDQNIFRASGNVIVTYEDIRVEADEVTYDELTKDVNATERVRFTRGTEHLQAQALKFNLNTKSGTLTAASGEIGPGFFITAGEV